MFRRYIFFRLLLLAGLLAVVGVRASDAETTGLVAMRRERPAIVGAGISVAQPEGGGVDRTFEVNPVFNPSIYFTWTSTLGTATIFPNLVGNESSHANGVATQFYSTDTVGVAPGVPRVDSYDAGYFISFIINPKVGIAARVVNQSFINGGTESAYDAYASKFNVLFVSGMANEPGTPPPVPGSAYNGLGVGIISTSGQSSIGPTADGRAKPDLVAPHVCCTSFSTPQVAGAAALLLQAAVADDGGAGTAVVATNVSVIKALLLNGAVKMTNWTNGFRRPLDARYGAGVLNMYNSDWQLRGGRHVALATNSVSLNSPHPPTSETNNVTSLRGWDFAQLNSLASNDRVAHYYFHLPESNGACSATATLAWNKGSGALTNLDLFLYETTSNTLVTCSTSSVDNVEHLFVPKLSAGRYDLQVLLRGTNQPGSESYALAFDFSPVRLSMAASGTNAVVSWPASPAGYTLQSASSLDVPIAWQDVAASSSILSNAQNTATLPVVSAQFFRLFRP